MPTPDYNVANVLNHADVAQGSSACPIPLSPASQIGDHHDSLRTPDGHMESQSQRSAGRLGEQAMNDNTGAGMAQSQEDSMYISPVSTPPEETGTQATSQLSDKDRMDIVEEEITTPKVAQATDTDDSEQSDGQPLATPSCSPDSQAGFGNLPSATLPADLVVSKDHSSGRSGYVQYNRNGGHFTPPASPLQSSSHCIGEQQKRALPKRGIPKIDRELDWKTATPAKDFSYRRNVPQYPSSLFQCDSKYMGTQQSDRQIYNVNVRILTVDMAQSTCTGYLLIKGLTPEHDTLQTYFTGEIIGGPNQKYSFRTKNTEWGASDKTDLMHWARFSPWRSLNTHARRDIDFEYPVNGENWWEQEHIFMRWKEHFLVPDHKTRSIAGASFEGFYYICLNQVEGKISGIYFHSKSEKYQQLELKHEGETGTWHRGVTPAVEFR